MEIFEMSASDMDLNILDKSNEANEKGKQKNKKSDI